MIWMYWDNFWSKISPVQNDPMEAFALSHAGQVEAQAALAGPLLSSQSALIFNNKTGEVLYQKNPDRVMPIASISKLMSAMVVLDAHLDMNEPITITEAEIDRLKGTGSRLSIGTTLTRGELLHLSLMSSETVLPMRWVGTYPGGDERVRCGHECQSTKPGHDQQPFL